jgi:hypothetical protein
MTTTERSTSRRRWSKDAVRLAAWGTGAATFLGSVAAIAVAPKPAPGEDGTTIAQADAPAAERHVIRRIIVIEPSEPSAPVAVLQEPAATQPASAPPPAPATSTGGS